MLRKSRIAVQSLSAGNLLTVVVVICGGVKKFAYVKEIGLGRRGQPLPASISMAEIQLFYMPQDAAEELSEAISQQQGWSTYARDASEILGSLDESDWTNLKSPPRGGSAAVLESYLTRSRRTIRGPFSTNLTPDIRQALVNSEAFDDFQKNLQGLVSHAHEEEESLAASRLTHPIRTLSGNESIVPDFVRRIAGRVSSFHVLHEADRRQPIGRPEAERLLSLKVQRGGPEILAGIQDTVASLLGVRLDAFQSDERSSVRSIRGEQPADIDVDNFLVEVNGSGIREALRLILDVEFEDPHLLLIEETGDTFTSCT